MTLTVGSLFTGIGGIDLGLERAGMQVIWQSEIDPFCCQVLAKHWPDVPNLGDVTEIDWSSVGRPDLICGGYPCQPFSLAGARGGETDTRHLWPHFERALRVLRPGWALLENVPGHLSLGFDTVQADLADLGYDTEWESIPAAAVGAPHLRWRIFLVAHTDGSGRRTKPWQFNWVGFERRGTPVADTLGSGLEVVECEPDNNDQERSAAQRDSDQWSWWLIEPDVGRVAHGIPHRVDRLRALGNAVVPQVAELVGRQIIGAAA